MAKKVAPTLCPKCKKIRIYFTGDICHNCYRKFIWKPKKQICKRCNRLMPIKAKGLCGGCYNFIYCLEEVKKSNRKKRYGVSEDLYREKTQKCFVCGFDKVVDLHHLDENNKNNSPENLLGLCPNHHKMLHDFRFRKEIRDKLEQKGVSLPEDPKLDFHLEED